MADKSILWIENNKWLVQPILNELEKKRSTDDKNYLIQYHFYIDDAMEFITKDSPTLDLIITNVWDGDNFIKEYLPKLKKLNELYKQTPLLILSEFVNNSIYSKKIMGESEHTQILKRELKHFKNVYFKNFFSNILNDKSELQHPYHDVLVAIDDLLKK
ncbi:MAG: hypothetical protein WC758_00725 [Candidatus Woesearchaeota archaeon]|jgi:hypothetical protein